MTRDEFKEQLQMWETDNMKFPQFALDYIKQLEAKIKSKKKETRYIITEQYQGDLSVYNNVIYSGTDSKKVIKIIMDAIDWINDTEEEYRDPFQRTHNWETDNNLTGLQVKQRILEQLKEAIAGKAYFEFTTDRIVDDGDMSGYSLSINHGDDDNDD